MPVATLLQDVTIDLYDVLLQSIMAVRPTNLAVQIGRRANHAWVGAQHSDQKTHEKKSEFLILC